MASVHIVQMSGNSILLESPAQVGDAVCDVRCRVAAALNLDAQRILLLSGSTELVDGQTIPEQHGMDALVITAALMPCAVRPEKYEDYITRGQRLETDFFVKAGEVEFPEPSGISINMMPFIIGDPDSIPAKFRQYWPMIEACPGLHREAGYIGYLTLQESWVESGRSQRRPGLHLETPGLVMSKGGETAVDTWGMGDIGDGNELIGGIYMASNLSDSCRVWNVQVKQPENMVGANGDIEHLREILGCDEGILVKSGELVWLTDTTPHESLPMPEETYRQYFRLVTSAVSLWYDDHSTKNPLGIMPDPQFTRVVYGDKFEKPPQRRLDPSSIPISQSNPLNHACQTIPYGDVKNKDPQMHGWSLCSLM